jgi:hypothetical protein
VTPVFKELLTTAENTAPSAVPSATVEGVIVTRIGPPKEYSTAIGCAPILINSFVGAEFPVLWLESAIATVYAWVALWGVGLSESVAVRLKLKAPGTLGTPLMVFEVRNNPFGREPEEIDHA